MVESLATGVWTHALTSTHCRCGASVGGTDCNVFRYSPPSRPLGSLTPTQPERVTNPTQGHPGLPWGAPQVECWPLRREPQPPAQHGSCAAERCRSRARPGQRLPPCMHSGGTSRHLLVTSPKRAHRCSTPLRSTRKCGVASQRGSTPTTEPVGSMVNDLRLHERS